MGILKEIWKLDIDPDDAVNGYTPYSFLPAGKTGIPNLSLLRDFARRESVLAIPSLDSVLDGNGRAPGSMERRDFTAGFRVIVGPGGDLDAAYDRLAAVLAPGSPVRLVYQTDSDPLGQHLWFTVGSNPIIRHTQTAENKGLTAYVDFAVTWRIRPDWRPRFSEASDIWGNGDGTWGTADGNWGAAHTIQVTTDPFSFTLDARGTAGYDLPTIPDTGPLVQLTGPLGGANGLAITNLSPDARVMTDQGVLAGPYFIVPKLLAGEQAYLDFARQYFIVKGAVNRPFKPAYQRQYTLVWPGVLNTIQLVAQGGSVVTGGYITWDWWRKRA